MRMVSFAVQAKTLVAGLALIYGSCVQAERPDDSFKSRVNVVLSEHHLAKMVDADLEAAEAQVSVERSAYFPKIDVNASTGYQDIDRDVGASDVYDPKEVSVSVNQLIYDFGATSAKVDVARQVTDKESLENALQRKNLIFAAVEAHLELVKAHRLKEFAEKSEENVRVLTQQENARVDAGKGYATDVLQAKAQLASAEARRVVANSDLNIAENRYKAVYGYLQPAGVKLETLNIPSDLLPTSLAEVEQLVTEASPDVLAALARHQVARASLQATSKSEYMPRVDLALSHARYEDRDGTEGSREDSLATLNFRWSFDSGLKASHLVTAANAQALSESEKANYVLVQSLEEARNAWNSWGMSQDRTRYLLNQVEISKLFLKLALKERGYGRRSLLDILNAATALINAESAAAEAELDETLSAFRLLRASGRLDLELFDNPSVVITKNAS
ncbi:TolC family protein [Amphritea sp. 1_MG-2023]|uniref:TolC family protein n=1 Tax=Amphritea sp. 1_MG-2023 TaxID=3062670 RepID=UPI0026E1DDB2|nr:TolC family protein [Amphritea sp. 1_MG-2023]MDO6565294.1 TolC family protein [Amphritea sp. 1_MG-2023]